jgi:hypothetical protein
MKGVVWRSRSDTRLYMYSCVFVFFLVCLKVIFSFPKKENKKQKAIVRHMVGWRENVPVTHLYVSSLASFESSLVLYSEHCESLVSLTYVYN